MHKNTIFKTNTKHTAYCNIDNFRAYDDTYLIYIDMCEYTTPYRRNYQIFFEQKNRKTQNYKQVTYNKIQY